jgi:hypothetical protein
MKNSLLLFILILAMACGSEKQKEQGKPDSEEKRAELKKYLTKYEPYEMSFDASGYNKTDKAILKKLVNAAMYVDTIYWLQTSKYGLKLRDSLEQVKSDPYANDLLTLIRRNGGPYEHLSEYEAFYGSLEYYGGDELYPRGMTAQQFDAYLDGLTKEKKNEFMYPYTVIKEDGKGGYKAVRYGVEYKKYVNKIAALLNEAADLSDNESFSKFLKLKAEGLKTDNYFDTDVAWIDTKDTKFDIVFGPFETYSDKIKGVKAKYEAYIEIVDQQASADLEIYKSYLQRMEGNLPIPEEYKSVVEGLTANFIVVRDIIRTGEGSIGYQAVATNLPNDPEVHAKKGTKKTFWKNMFEARFNAIIKPVSNRLIEESQLEYLSDDGFFMFVLMHEICHAIGPRTVKVGPKKGMAVNAAIGPNYSPLEEAKADVVGLYSLAYLMKEGVVDPAGARNYYVSFLGSLFRSIRFGLDEAHGKAAAISLNYLVTNGGINYDEATNKWSIDFENFEEGIKKLSSDLMILEGDGDNEKVEAFFAKWTKETPQLTKAFETVEDIAIDVLPIRSIKWD